MKIKKQKKIIHPYSEESINKKQNISFLLILLLKTSTLYPIFDIFINSNILGRFKIINTNSDVYRIAFPLIISLCISLILTKKKNIKDPLFIDDEVIISNKKKSNGNYEDIYTTKFNIILGSNIIIIPLIFIISLTFSTLISTIFNLIIPSIIYKKLINYLFLSIIFWFLFGYVNRYLISYIRKK